MGEKYDKFGLRSWRGKYVSVQPDGSVVCDRNSLSAWESIKFESFGGGKGCLKSGYGKYLSSSCGNVEWNRDKAAGWETWTIMGGPNGVVGFKDFDGKYLSAQPDNSLKINRDVWGPWEYFTVVDAVVDDEKERGSGTSLDKYDKFGLRSSEGKYVSVQPDGSVVCDRSSLSAWESIKFETFGGGKGCLKSWNGKYLSSSCGNVEWNRNKAAGWETWTIMGGPNGVVGFKDYFGKYLSAQPNGSLQVNRDGMGDWESFTVVGC